MEQLSKIEPVADQHKAEDPEKVVLKNFPKSGKGVPMMMVAFSFLVVIAGVATGWILTGETSAGDSGTAANVTGVEESATEAGIQDESGFETKVEGILEEGGIEGEGTHHLVRDGGPTKYVYLTSAVIDLQSFVGKKVTVWGDTISAKSAPWLVEAGKVKVTK